MVYISKLMATARFDMLKTFARDALANEPLAIGSEDETSLLLTALMFNIKDKDKIHNVLDELDLLSKRLPNFYNECINLKAKAMTLITLQYAKKGESIEEWLGKLKQNLGSESQGYTRLMRLISLYMKSPEYCDLICEGKWVNFRRDVFSLVERISLTFAPDVQEEMEGTQDVVLIGNNIGEENISDGLVNKDSCGSLPDDSVCIIEVEKTDSAMEGDDEIDFVESSERKVTTDDVPSDVTTDDEPVVNRIKKFLENDNTSDAVSDDSDFENVPSFSPKYRPIPSKTLTSKIMWSDENVKLLIDGVNRLGEGNWISILKYNKFPSCINNNQIRYKWRNLVKFDHVRKIKGQWVLMKR